MTSTSGTWLSGDAYWRDHRVVAACLRTAILVVPLALSIAAGTAAAWSVTGRGTAAVVARTLAAGAASVLTFSVLEWLARRLLPLVSLLRLTLVFPDRVPSRFAMALRSGSVRHLREWARVADGSEGADALAEKVLTLAAALNFHDRRTRGHSERTRALAELLIDDLKLPSAQANEVRWGAFLHDIGKLLVPAAILNKAGAPSRTEWEEIKQHPAIGARLVEPLRPFLGTGIDAVGSHHENWDGSGYPKGLGGDAIPLTARVVTVVDSFEVMTAVRSYKPAMSAAAARRELVRHSGSQFDPEVVRAFLNVSLGRLHWALGAVAWLAELPFVGLVPRAAAQVGAVVGTGGTAVSTATLASVATATLGASLIPGPVQVPAATGASRPPAAVSFLNGPSVGGDAANGAVQGSGSGAAGGSAGGTAGGSAGGSLPPATAANHMLGGSGKTPGRATTAPGQSGTTPVPSGTTPGPSGTTTSGRPAPTTTARSGTTTPGQSGTTSSGVPLVSTVVKTAGGLPVVGTVVGGATRTPVVGTALHLLGG